MKRFPLADSSDHVLSRSAGKEDSWSNDVEFLNNVLLRVSNRKELLEAYLKADSLAKGLRGALGEK